MAFPSTGGGYQVGDGNLNEIQISESPNPQTATVTATLTAAQIANDMLVGSPGASAASYTLPTVAQLEAVIFNAKVGTTFDLAIVNLGNTSGVLTIVTNTGWTLVGAVTIAIATSAQIRFRKSADSAWTLYRIT